MSDPGPEVIEYFEVWWCQACDHRWRAHKLDNPVECDECQSTRIRMFAIVSLVMDGAQMRLKTQLLFEPPKRKK